MASSIDPLWADVALLINAIGAHDSTDYYDAKTHPLTASGTVRISTVDPDFPSGALRITGGAYIALSDSTDYDFPEDLTIEFDYKAISKASANPAMVSLYSQFGANGGMTFFDRHSGAPSSYAAAVNGVFPRFDTPSAGNGVKQCFRYVRTGDIFELYINDEFVSSYTQAGQLNAWGGIWIGASGDSPGGTYADALIGRIRITRAARTEPQGTAPYPES